MPTTLASIPYLVRTTLFPSLFIVFTNRLLPIGHKIPLSFAVSICHLLRKRPSHFTLHQKLPDHILPLSTLPEALSFHLPGRLHELHQ